MPLVKTLMTLRGVSQRELAEKAEVSVSAMSRFLNGSSELRSDALLKTLSVLGADVDSIMIREIDKALGRDLEYSIGEDIRLMMEKASPITRKTVVDMLISNLKADGTADSKQRLTRIKKYRDSIKTMRRLN